jgi:DNA-binding protein HU-beta
MNQSELIGILSQRMGLSRRTARYLFQATVRGINTTLGNHSGISIPGLGTFGTHIRHKRKTYSPYHKSMMDLPPKRTVFFHPSVGLKSEIKDVEVKE